MFVVSCQNKTLFVRNWFLCFSVRVHFLFLVLSVCFLLEIRYRGEFSYGRSSSDCTQPLKCHIIIEHNIESIALPFVLTFFCNFDSSLSKSWGDTLVSGVKCLMSYIVPWGISESLRRNIFMVPTTNSFTRDLHIRKTQIGLVIVFAFRFMDKA